MRFSCDERVVCDKINFERPWTTVNSRNEEFLLTEKNGIIIIKKKVCISLEFMNGMSDKTREKYRENQKWKST